MPQHCGRDRREASDASPVKIARAPARGQYFKPDTMPKIVIPVYFDYASTLCYIAWRIVGQLEC